MVPQQDRAETTIKMVVTPELATEVAQRVDEGHDSSPSELFREALLLLIRNEGARSPVERRLDETLVLHAQALERPRAAMGISEMERRKRVAQLSLERELHPGIRLAPERMARILRGPGPDREP